MKGEEIKMKTRINQLEYNKMDSELICPLCEDQYQDENPPRLLTGCGHSYCESCLKKIMTEKKGAFKIVCPEDGEMVTLKDSSVNNFPKNMALLKIIESKNNNLSFKDSSLQVSKIAKNDDAQEDDDARDLVDAIISSKNATTSDDNIQPQEQEANQSQQAQVQMCLLHQKPLEVVCVIDLKKICANCAIFGEHKGHEFKSLQEIECERMDYYTSIIDIMDKKQTISTRISNQETCSSIMQILENKKEKMRKSITDKYRKLLETIQQKQAESLKNLNSVINKTQSKLKNLMKIDPNILQKYDIWEGKSYNQIKILEGDDFQAKLQLLFLDNSADTDDVIEEGDKIIEEMNKQEENLINEVEGALQNIGVQFNQEIFNHIEGFVELYDEAKKKKSKRAIVVGKTQKIQTVNPSRSQPPFSQPKKEQQQTNQAGKTAQPNKVLQDMTHYTSSDQNETENEKIITSIIQMNTDEDLLEQQDVEVKKPQFFKQPPVEHEKIYEKVEHPSPISEKKKEEKQSVDKLEIHKNSIQKQVSPSQTQRYNKKDTSFQKLERPNKKKLLKVKTPSEKYEKVLEGLGNDSLELLDLTNAELGDGAILIISQFLHGSKVKTVKFIRNKLNDDTIAKILPYMGGVLTLNLSQNLLTERVLDILINGRDYMPLVKSIILSQNKIIERKSKAKIDKLRSLDVTVSV